MLKRLLYAAIWMCPILFGEIASIIIWLVSGDGRGGIIFTGWTFFLIFVTIPTIEWVTGKHWEWLD
jgi:hypothetical protein